MALKYGLDYRCDWETGWIPAAIVDGLEYRCDMGDWLYYRRDFGDGLFIIATGCA